MEIKSHTRQKQTHKYFSICKSYKPLGLSSNVSLMYSVRAFTYDTCVYHAHVCMLVSSHVCVHKLLFSCTCALVLYGIHMTYPPLPLLLPLRSSISRTQTGRGEDAVQSSGPLVNPNGGLTALCPRGSWINPGTHRVGGSRGQQLWARPQ